MTEQRKKKKSELRNELRLYSLLREKTTSFVNMMIFVFYAKSLSVVTS